MGRSTPDPPAGQAKQVILVQQAPTGTRRKCGYCSRWNDGTACDGCGAPIDWADNALADKPLPVFPLNRIVR